MLTLYCCQIFDEYNNNYKKKTNTNRFICSNLSAHLKRDYKSDDVGTFGLQLVGIFKMSGMLGSLIRVLGAVGNLLSGPT